MRPELLSNWRHARTRTKKVGFNQDDPFCSAGADQTASNKVFRNQAFGRPSHAATIQRHEFGLGVKDGLFDFGLRLPAQFPDIKGMTSEALAYAARYPAIAPVELPVL